MYKLGVDFGGVITDRVNEHTDTSFFGDDFLATTATEGSFDALQRLNAGERFRDNIWLVSKCGKRIQDRTEQWLVHNGFYEATGIEPSHKFFTPKRIGKVAIAEDLGLTHFVDDRLEILGSMVGTVANLYLFDPMEREVAAHEWALPHVTVVEGWGTLEDKLLEPIR